MWNGKDLVDEFSRNLGDTSERFKGYVKTWINDIEREICSDHTWGFLLTKGKKTLTSGEEEQSLLITAPSAPTVAIAAGGSLTSGSTYKVKLSHYDPNSKNEIISEESASVTASGANLTINLSGLSVSSEEYFTQRRIYLSKDDGEFYLYATITNQSSTTSSITAETTSKIIAPEFTYINKLSGNPFFESNMGQLDYLPIDQLRLLYSGEFTSGTPESWGDMSHDKVLLYPKPSSALELSFYYYKVPRGIYYEKTSSPTLPISFKNVLEAGIEWKGAKFRDRSDASLKYEYYQKTLQEAIEDLGKVSTANARVRDVVGDSSGKSY